MGYARILGSGSDLLSARKALTSYQMPYQAVFRGDNGNCYLTACIGRHSRQPCRNQDPPLQIRFHAKWAINETLRRSNTQGARQHRPARTTMVMTSQCKAISPMSD